MPLTVGEALVAVPVAVPLLVGADVVPQLEGEALLPCQRT